ncbi:hypothetical protein ABFX02_08G165700 [Erythranthe guttata]
MSTNSCNSFRSRGRHEGFCSVVGGHTHPFVCHCGLAVKVQTSWTDLNPGRRFVTCPTRGANKCQFYYWCDAKICDRGKIIIPGLLKKLNALQSKVAVQETQIKQWKTVAFCISMFLVIATIISVI